MPEPPLSPYPVAPLERVAIAYRPRFRDDDVELPLRLLFVGDYLGRPDPRPLRDRAPRGVHGESFATVLAELAPALSMEVEDVVRGGTMRVDLRFRRLADFGPEEVARQVPVLAALCETRALLTMMKGPLGGNPQLRKKIRLLRDDPETRAKLRREVGLPPVRGEPRVYPEVAPPRNDDDARTERALLEAIRAAPDDDRPREVYADWLLDRDDVLGEWIRVQCALARLRDRVDHDEDVPSLERREETLGRMYRRRWDRDPSGAGPRVAWGRGFVERVSLRRLDEDAAVDALLAREPVQTLYVDKSIRDLAGRLPSLGTSTVSVLHVSCEALPTLGDAMPRRLTALSLTGWRVKALAAVCGPESRIDTLDLSLVEHELRPRRARALCHVASPLRALTLGSLDFDLPTVEAIAASTWAESLEVLDVRRVGAPRSVEDGVDEVLAAAWEPLLACPRLRSLRTLLAPGLALGRRAVSGIAKATTRVLERLDLQGVALGPSAVELAAMPHLASLRALALSDLDAPTARAFATSPYLRALRDVRLSLEGDLPDAARASVEWVGGLADLRRLELKGLAGAFRDEEFAALATYPLPSLRHLALNTYFQISEAAARTLLAAPWIERLYALAGNFSAGAYALLHPRLGPHLRQYR